MRLRDFLELVRIPNVFTAAADVCAGYVYSGGSFADSWNWLLLVLASMCLYAGGIALNDVRDAEQDTMERPGRPIPSGRITRITARRASALLLASGVILSSFASWVAGAAATGLVSLIVIYNLVAKETAWGPLVMGACRAANLMLGMCLHSPPAIAAAIPAALLGSYIAGVTFLARDEARLTPANRVWIGTVVVMVSVMGLMALGRVNTGTPPGFPWVVCAFATGVLLLGARAARTGSALDVQRAVKVMILALFVFDGLIAATAGWDQAVLVLLLSVPSLILARKFQVT